MSFSVIILVSTKNNHRNYKFGPQYITLYHLRQLWENQIAYLHAICTTFMFSMKEWPISYTYIIDPWIIYHLRENSTKTNSFNRVTVAGISLVAYLHNCWNWNVQTFVIIYFVDNGLPIDRINLKRQADRLKN